MCFVFAALAAMTPARSEFWRARYRVPQKSSRRICLDIMAATARTAWRPRLCEPERAGLRRYFATHAA